MGNHATPPNNTSPAYDPSSQLSKYGLAFQALPVATSAPADADMSNGTVVFYVNGSTLTAKYKNSSGTVTSGAVATLS